MSIQIRHGDWDLRGVVILPVCVGVGVRGGGEGG